MAFGCGIENPFPRTIGRLIVPFPITILHHQSETWFEYLPNVVTPAKAGVQKALKRLDTGFRRYDNLPNFRSNSKLSFYGWG